MERRLAALLAFDVVGYSRLIRADEEGTIAALKALRAELAFDNLGGFRALRLHFNPKWAVFLFGLFHGFGLATKLQDVAISKAGLIGNMISFNVGVELGQFAALVIILLIFNLWRASGSFLRHAYFANSALMTAGFVLVGYQLVGYYTS